MAYWVQSFPDRRLSARQFDELRAMVDEARHQAQDLELAEMVKAAQKEAEKNGILGHGMHQPFESMFEGVFEEMPWHLREQSDQMIAERKAAGI